jgi:hypothetical protein
MTEQAKTPDQEPKLVSECHKADMKVVGTDEGTNHYECLECGEACNWVDAEPKPKPVQEPKTGKIVKGVAQDTNKNGTAGRPTDYKPEYCDSLIAFFDREPYDKVIMEEQERENTQKGTKSKTVKYKMIANKLPTFVQFARSIGVSTKTVWQWANDRTSDEPDAPLKYPEFSKAYVEAKELQKDFLIQNGLQGTTPSGAFIFVAKNLTDMVDRQLVEHDVPDLKEKRDALDNFIDTLRDNVQPTSQDVS